MFLIDLNITPSHRPSVNAARRAVCAACSGLTAERCAILMHSESTQQPVKKHEDQYCADKAATPAKRAGAGKSRAKNTHVVLPFRKVVAAPRGFRTSALNNAHARHNIPLQSSSKLIRAFTDAL